MSRLFNKKQKSVLKWLSKGFCQICGDRLPTIFHADHVLPFSKGGKTNLLNGQALCQRCNLSKGAK